MTTLPTPAATAAATPAPAPSPAPVTVIGLGSMGSALAAALLGAGHAVTVWNRSADKARELVGRGARLAPSPAQAVASSPLTVVCVLDYEVMYALFGDDDLTGRTLVNLCSGSPEQAREAAGWAAARGAAYLDGAIMTTPPGVGSAEMMFLYSGSREVFETWAPVLRVLGDPLYLGADQGMASLYDAALLGLMWAALTGWLHGTALVGSEKATAADFTAIAVRWLGAVSGFMTTYAGQVDAGHYPGDDATVDVQIAAIDHLLHAAGARGLDNALPELLKATMQRAKAAGHGASSYAGVIEVLRAPGR
ncbi:NAD(P)-dependent oxidoreductase [Streptomyces sp. NPDC090022]|uniref:NAD(P)-dependent oxidoreductase n=1 Tax=Streptomyces sp. NPDC090022 TaxID=3365920 RepID=UPI00380AA295